VVKACAGDVYVVGVELDAEEASLLEHGGDAGGAAAAEGVEDQTAGRCGEPDEPAHDLDRFDRGVGVSDGARPPAPLIAGVGEEVELAGGEVVAAGVAFAA
jgi:hypothetical protein